MEPKEKEETHEVYPQNHFQEKKFRSYALLQEPNIKFPKAVSKEVTEKQNEGGYEKEQVL